jgi:hypothetical protein
MSALRRLLLRLLNALHPGRAEPDLGRERRRAHDLAGRDFSAAESTRSRIAIINGGPLFEDNVMSFAAANHSRVKDKAKYGATPVFEIAK